MLHQYFREANQFPNIAGMASFDTLTLDDGQIKISFGKGLEKKSECCICLCLATPDPCLIIHL